MDEDLEIEQFISDIRKAFPDVGRAIDVWMEKQGFDEEDKAYASMFEAFSQETTNEMKRLNEGIVRSHLEYMSKKLSRASKKEYEYIDVYYVESLMWDINDKGIKKWAWALMPANLKELYVDMWGPPTFNK